jgi:broad specificity phosphatase PhoE
VTRAARRELWLIRHAESAWNAMGMWQGHADPGLSPRGLVQAEALAKSLDAHGIEAIAASDLRRARETARVLAAALGLEASLDARLRERDLGSWSGLTTPQIAGRWPDDLARLRARDVEFCPGGGESIRQVAARAAGFFRELALRPGPARWAIVTHGGLIRARQPDRTTPIANAEAVRVTLDELLDALDAERRPTAGSPASDADAERL